eukprot:137447-Alexandrium_andersonii.AAC.1
MRDVRCGALFAFKRHGFREVGVQHPSLAEASLARSSRWPAHAANPAHAGQRELRASTPIAFTGAVSAAAICLPEF